MQKQRLGTVIRWLRERAVASHVRLVPRCRTQAGKHWHRHELEHLSFPCDC
jgi:hypothetical protein